MAYSATVTRTKINEVDSLYEITETDTTAGVDGDEFQITVQTTGRVFRYLAAITSGSGTIDPVISASTGVTTGVDVVLSNDAADTEVDLQPTSPVFFYTSGGILYINNYASTSGLNIKTKIFVRDTWGL